jgi:hypothetical protein
MSRLFATVCVATAVAVIGTQTAGATVVDRGTYSGTEPFVVDDCDFPLNGVSTFSGHFRARADHGGQAFYALDNYRFRDVITNPETGKWFVIRGNGLFIETKATLVEGTVYEFVQHDAGQPFVIEDSAGRVIVRDRGLVSTNILFDTLGDGQPGGEPVAELDVVFRGPHPGSEVDVCAIAAELTGAD